MVTYTRVNEGRTGTSVHLDARLGHHGHWIPMARTECRFLLWTIKDLTRHIHNLKYLERVRTDDATLNWRIYNSESLLQDKTDSALSPWELPFTVDFCPGQSILFSPD